MQLGFTTAANLTIGLLNGERFLSLKGEKNNQALFLIWNLQFVFQPVVSLQNRRNIFAFFSPTEASARRERRTNHACLPLDVTRSPRSLPACFRSPEKHQKITPVLQASLWCKVKHSILSKPNSNQFIRSQFLSCCYFPRSCSSSCFFFALGLPLFTKTRHHDMESIF